MRRPSETNSEARVLVCDDEERDAVASGLLASTERQGSLGVRRGVLGEDKLNGKLVSDVYGHKGAFADVQVLRGSAGLAARRSERNTRCTL